MDMAHWARQRNREKEKKKEMRTRPPSHHSVVKRIAGGLTEVQTEGYTTNACGRRFPRGWLGRVFP